MAIRVDLNSVDRTDHILWESFTIDNVSSNQANACNFNFRRDKNNKTTIPSVNDVVEVFDNGTEIFSGVITRAREQVTSELYTYIIEAVGHSRELDRFLVVNSFDEKEVGFVINNIFNDHVNTERIVLATMESGESWTDETGSTSVDTDNIRFGDQSRKFAPSASSSVISRKEFAPARDLTLGDGSEVFSDVDVMTFFARVANVDRCESIKIRQANETGGSYTNYREYTFDVAGEGFVNGFIFFAIPLDDPGWVEVGSFDNTDLQSLQANVTATAAGGADVSIDDIRIIRLDGFTQNNVDGSAIISTANFNYEQVSDVFTQIARELAYEWNLNVDRDLFFLPPSSTLAPVDLEDDNDTFHWNSLELEDDLSELVNRIYIRGANEFGVPRTDDLSVQADGTNVIFLLPYKYRNVTVEVNSVAQDVGVDFIDPPASKDVLFNFNEKVLKFTVAPGNGITVEITGEPEIPIIVKKSDNASVADFGVFEHRVVDKALKSRPAARERAQAELNMRKDTITEGSFSTHLSGFEIGQQLRINSAERGIDETYIINKVTIQMDTPTDFIYFISLVTTRTYGIIEFLQSLLRREAKDIDINENETVDLVESYEEAIAIAEGVAIASPGQVDAESATIADVELDYIDSPPIWVAGPYAPTSLFPDRKRPMFSDRDNLLGS